MIDIYKVMKKTRLTERRVRYLLEKYPEVFSPNETLDEETIYMFLLYKKFLQLKFGKQKILKEVLPWILTLPNGIFDYGFITYGKNIEEVSPLPKGIEFLKEGTAFSYFDHKSVKREKL